MQPAYDPSSTGQMMYNNPEMDYQRAGYPPSLPPGQQQQPPPQMMKPPPSNAYGMPPPLPSSQVSQPPSSMAPQHRPTGPYPSIASKPQQPQQMVPSAQQDYNVAQTSNLVCVPPNQQAPPPPTTAGPQQTYHYPPQQQQQQQQQPMPR
ncbi:unnamed protein product [Rotaria sp. Silwood1]|nr:unnamed protein product [Rotaria sp. Silwood1]